MKRILLNDATLFDETIEPILKENKNRYTLFPIIYDDIYDLYKLSEANIWTVAELDFSKDIEDFENLNDKEKFFIKNILAFFATSDGIVNENLVLNFYNTIQIAEARALYGVQVHIENVHNETYSLMIDTFITDQNEKTQLLNAIETVDVIKNKADWALRYITNGSFIERLVAFSAVEGIFFSGSFCAIFWLKSRNIMTSGFCKSNEWISRDEALHCRTAIMLYNKLIQYLDESIVHNIYKEAVELECQFIDYSLPEMLFGMNPEHMKDYIKYIADSYLTLLGYNKIWNKTCPFDFMKTISLDIKTNFFEEKNTSYQKLNRVNTNEKLTFDTDF